VLNGMIIKLEDCEVEEVISEDRWVGIAKYVSPDSQQNQPINNFHVSFDISGVSTHITHTRNTVGRYPAYGHDFKGAIGVNEDGTIEGVDIQIPALTVSINATLAEATVNDAYIAGLLNIVGAVNSGNWHEFVAGTCLLASVSGQQRDDKAWDISAKVACQPNETGLSVGDISGIAKRGWDYMWVYYVTKEDTPSGGGAKLLSKQPDQVFVEEVYRYVSYSGLGF